MYCAFIYKEPHYKDFGQQGASIWLGHWSLYYYTLLLSLNKESRIGLILLLLYGSYYEGTSTTAVYNIPTHSVLCLSNNPRAIIEYLDYMLYSIYCLPAQPPSSRGKGRQYKGRGTGADTWTKKKRSKNTRTLSYFCFQSMAWCQVTF